MKLTAMSEEQARAICNWSYSPPYEVYNMGPWSRVVERGWALGNPQKRACEMLSLVDEFGALLGYLRLSERDERWMIAVGLRPEQCGRGFGTAAIELGLRAHRRRAPSMPLWLEVRDWNTRAIRCYERSGFVAVDRVKRQAAGSPGVFVVMRLAARRSI